MSTSHPKLRLSKETLLVLSSEQITRVAGAFDKSNLWTCHHTDHCTQIPTVAACPTEGYGC